MNTKRQTIWLVSMLSLMVVLSAYYLFTDTVGEVENVSETDGSQQFAATDEVLIDEHSTEAEMLDGIAGDITDGTLNTEASQSEAPQSETAIPDEKVLQKVQAGAQNGQDYLAALEIKRNDELSKEVERLFEITLDTKKSSEEIAKAAEEIRKIEEIQFKVSDLEDQLMRDFENVVITEEKGKWKVVVQADKLERSQAVTIIDMVIKNLQVAPSKIAGIQFVQ
jgi:stage III sporulation protein AH